MLNLIRHLIAGAVILFVAFAAANGQSTDQPRNEIEVRGNVSIPTGSADFSGTTDSSQTIDFARDFSFDNKLGFDLRFIHRSENQKHKFLVQYGRDNWDQQRTLTRSFMFLGQTYVANASADLGVTIRVFRAMYSYRWGNEKVHFGPMVDLGVISTNVKLTGTTNNGTRSAEGTISKFAATVGYDLEANPTSKLNLFHNLGAIAFQGEHLFHTEGGLKYFASRHFGAVGGYRFSRYKLEDNNNFVLVRQHGPFFGGVVRF
jgi:hypothetical protein